MGGGINFLQRKLSKVLTCRPVSLFFSSSTRTPVKVWIGESCLMLSFGMYGYTDATFIPLSSRYNLTSWRGGEKLVATVAAVNPSTIVVIHASGLMTLEDWISVSLLSTCRDEGEKDVSRSRGLMDLALVSLLPFSIPMSPPSFSLVSLGKRLETQLLTFFMESELTVALSGVCSAIRRLERLILFLPSALSPSASTLQLDFPSPSPSNDPTTQPTLLLLSLLRSSRLTTLRSSHRSSSPLSPLEPPRSREANYLSCFLFSRLNIDYRYFLANNVGPRTSSSSSVILSTAFSFSAD